VVGSGVTAARAILVGEYGSGGVGDDDVGGGERCNDGPIYGWEGSSLVGVAVAGMV